VKLNTQLIRVLKERYDWVYASLRKPRLIYAVMSVGLHLTRIGLFLLAHWTWN